MNQRCFFLLTTFVAAVLAAAVGTCAAPAQPPTAPDRVVDAAEAPSPQPSPKGRGGEAPADEQIVQWVADLDSGRYQVRERATRNLLDTGAAALDALLAAANGERPEPADRAVWILQQLADAPKHELALAALDRLVQLRDRSDLAEQAAAARTRLRILMCQQRLASLGGRLTLQQENVAAIGVVTVVCVRLDDEWRGAVDDLRALAELDDQPYFRLEGPEVDDAAVRLFETNDRLVLLQLFDTRVTSAAVDALKVRQPAAVVYARNRALMGIAAESHDRGVLVTRVQPGSGAASAGIVQNDIIASMDGRPLPDFDRLTVRIAQHDPGDTVELEIIRNHKQLRKQVKLGSWAAVQIQQ